MLAASVDFGLREVRLTGTKGSSTLRRPTVLSQPPQRLHGSAAQLLMASSMATIKRTCHPRTLPPPQVRLVVVAGSAADGSEPLRHAIRVVDSGYSPEELAPIEQQ